MDAVFGIAGKDWVVIVTDCAVNRSIFCLVDTEDKICEISSHKIMGMAGEQTDRYQYSNFIKRNLELQEMRTGCELGVEATAQYMRTELAKALRKGPYQVNLLIGGFDQHENRAKMYWMDYLGTLQQLNKGAQGYASYFVNSILDNHFQKDMTLEQGLAACRMCIKELRTRFTINQHDFQAKIVTRDGIKVMKKFE